MKILNVVLITVLMTLLAGCANLADGSDQPFTGSGGKALNMILVNHNHRPISQAFVSTNWAANAGAGDVKGPGGGGIVCCYNVTDWRKPVKVMWTFSAVREQSIDHPDGSYTPGKVLIPKEDHVAMVSLPPRMPISSDDRFKRERNLCVIFRDLNTVELQYTAGFDCEDK
ncbi:MAG: hypothetical protein RL571_300 [Pseudomonadota bacterium]|jgi:hypothetical protein